MHSKYKNIGLSKKKMKFKNCYCTMYDARQYAKQYGGQNLGQNAEQKAEQNAVWTSDIVSGCVWFCNMIDMLQNQTHPDTKCNS